MSGKVGDALIHETVVETFAAMQMDRIGQENVWVKQMRYCAPSSKITWSNRLAWKINSLRVVLAKWIAGDNWPDSI